MKLRQALVPIVVLSFSLQVQLVCAGFDAAEKAFSEGLFDAAYKEYLADGSAASLNRLGLMHLHELCTSCQARDALGYFKRAAELGLADAQFNLGYLLEHAQDAGRDIEGARKWYRLAAWQGHGDAGKQLDELSRKGEGITAGWYRRDAERGNANAQFNLGAVYHSGEGVEKDWYIAAKWLRLAAENGVAQAAPLLAEIYSSPQGGGYDPVAAARWLEVAAQAGDGESQFLLGQRYLRGDGVKSNYHRGVELLMDAATTGSEHARDMLLELGVQPPKKNK